MARYAELLRERDEANRRAEEADRRAAEAERLSLKSELERVVRECEREKAHLLEVARGEAAEAYKRGFKAGLDAMAAEVRRTVEGREGMVFVVEDAVSQRQAQ
jgi:hypothetical protein